MSRGSVEGALVGSRTRTCWGACCLALLSVAAAAGSASAEPVTTIRDNGDPANRLDVVILGDGYTASQQAQYASDAERFAQGLFAQEPFREYQRYFNVYRVDVVSNQSGADHPEANPPRFVDTALDATYDCAGVQRLICVDIAKVNAVVANSVPASHRDLVIVIVNDPVYGGSGGAVAVASLDPSAVEIVLHETGHTLGLLADEYGGPPPPSCVLSVEPAEANATKETVRQGIKWRDWIDALTPVPTTAASPGVPGLYEGARYCDFGLYRPTYNSKMRSLFVPFEQVNSEQLVRRIYNWVSPIDAAQPTAATMTIPQGQRQTFQVQVPAPTSHSLAVAWAVDGQARGTGLAFTLDAMGLTAGAHVLDVTVTDPTALVRSDPSGALTESHRWDVTVTVGIAAPTNLGARAVSSTQIDLQWQDNSSNETQFRIERRTGAAGTWGPIGTVGANVTRFSNVGLTAGTPYWYRVRACNAVGCSEYSNEASETSTPILPPTSVAAVARSSVQIDVTWVDASTNETQFRLERKTGTAGTWAPLVTLGANAVGYVNVGLTGNTTYSYRLRACNAGGCSPYSGEASATTAGIAAPTALVATAILSTQIALAWQDNSLNEAQFRIERKTGPGGSWVQIAALGASVVSYTNTGLLVNTTYYYRVRACNTGGCSPYSNEAPITTASIAAPNLTATAISSARIDLGWQDHSADESQFRIERKTGPGGAWAQIAVAAANATSYQNTGLAASTVYYYRVRACNAGGCSVYSNEASTTTLAAAQVAIGPATLNFGDVPVGTCRTAQFAVQHVLGSAPASGSVAASPGPTFAITGGTPWSVSNGAAQNVDVRFCPGGTGLFPGTATVTTSASANRKTVSLSGSGSSQATNVISNGGFESGASGWVLTGSFQADSRFASPHSGTGYAYLANLDGSPGNNLVGTMYQTIAIPASATSAVLSFWYKITTQESGPTPFDVLNVTIQNAVGVYLQTVGVYSNAHASSQYAQAAFDAITFKGQTIRVHFLGTTDFSLPTTFRIDDVSLVVQ